MAGPRFDLFDPDTNPVFGVPVVGNAMNYDQIIAGWLADLLTDPNSPAGKMAREQGLLHSWQARTDISDPAKLGVELLAGLVPDLAIGALTKGANLPFTQAKTMAKVGGLMGKLGKTEHALASTKLMDPIANKLFEGAEWALKKTPGVKELLAPSAAGQAAHAVNEAAGVTQGLKRTGFGGLSYGDLADAAAEVKKGTFTRDDFASAFKLSTTDADTLLKVADQVDLTKLAKRSKTEDEFLGGIVSAYDKKITPPKGKSHVPDVIANPYRHGISYMKEGMLAGPTFVQNAIDIFGKSFIEGGFGGLRRVAEAVPKTAKRAEQAIPGFKKFTGSDDVTPELGVGNIIPSITGRTGKETGLGAASPWKLGALGAATGALTGDVVGVALNAAQMVGMKYGFKFNTKAMSTLESAARQVHFLDGVTDYFTHVKPKYFKPARRDALLQEVDDIAEKAGKKAELTEFVVKNNFLVTPEEVGAEAARLMGSNTSSHRIEQLWREIHSEARQAGTEYANKINFDYTNDTKLTAFLRNWSPFPVWPLHNIPYYGKQMVKYPAIPAMIASAASKSDQVQEAYDLPSRFNDKVPLVDTGSGTVFIDPMAPLSIAGQFTEPPTRFSEEDPTLVDRFLDTVSSVGLGPNPFIGSALQAVGLANRGREMQDFIPLSRITRGVGQAMTGKNLEPETIFKAPLEGIRQAVAPDAVPESSYQEYLVRKKLAEVAVAQYGKPWEQVPLISKAMAEGAANPLWQEAQRIVGEEQAKLTLARRFTGVMPTFLPEEELAIRKAKAENPLPPNPTSADYARQEREAPLAQGYSGIYGSQDQVSLEAKLNTFYDLVSPTVKSKFLRDNPEVDMYFTWLKRTKETNPKADTSVDAYMKFIQANS